MPIPDYQTAMLPLLRLAADGYEHKFRDAIERLAQDFSLSDEEGFVEQIERRPI